MLHIFIDGDGCAVKEEVYRVAERYQLLVTVVANKPMNIPLADRCLKAGARELMQTLRQFGNIHGGPAPMEKKDRSRFLEKLDQIIQSIRRG